MNVLKDAIDASLPVLTSILIKIIEQNEFPNNLKLGKNGCGDII